MELLLLLHHALHLMDHRVQFLLNLNAFEEIDRPFDASAKALLGDRELLHCTSDLFGIKPLHGLLQPSHGFLKLRGTHLLHQRLQLHVLFHRLWREELLLVERLGHFFDPLKRLLHLLLHGLIPLHHRLRPLTLFPLHLVGLASHLPTEILQFLVRLLHLLQCLFERSEACLLISLSVGQDLIQGGKAKAIRLTHRALWSRYAIIVHHFDIVLHDIFGRQPERFQVPRMGNKRLCQRR